MPPEQEGSKSMRSSRAAVSAGSGSHHRGGSGRPVPRMLRTFLVPGSVMAWPVTR